MKAQNATKKYQYSGNPYSEYPETTPDISVVTTHERYLYSTEFFGTFKKHHPLFRCCVALFFLAAIWFGLFQTIRTTVEGLIRFSAMTHTQALVEQAYQKSQIDNQVLRQNIARSTSTEGIEELARNKLGWVGDDEILVRIPNN